MAMTKNEHFYFLVDRVPEKAGIFSLDEFQIVEFLEEKACI